MIIETPGYVKIHESDGLTIKYSHHFCDSFTQSKLSNLINQFFLPPLPDPRSGGITSNKINESGHESDNDEHNSDPSMASGGDGPNASKTQLETHIAGLSLLENSDACRG